MKVLYVTNLPAPYKIKFFSLFSDRVDLTVAYERETATDRDEKWVSDIQDRHFEEVYLGGIKVGADSSCSLKVISLIKKGGFDTVIMNGFSSPTSILAISYMRLHHIPFGIMCDGMLPGECGGVKRKLKEFLISSASYYLSSNEITSQVLREYGAKQNKIYLYPFSSVSDSDIVPGKCSKEEYKDIIGCSGKTVILYVGQFIHRKGIDILMKAFKNIIDKYGKSQHLILIGGGYTAEELSAEFTDVSDVKDNISVLGFKNPNELEDYYRAADVFVLPTREDIWGLVVNEAMGYGLPVVTTDRCGAGLAMVQDGDNGYIAPTEDPGALADRIEKIITGEGFRDSDGVCQSAIGTARHYTIEKMAERTYEIMLDVVS